MQRNHSTPRDPSIWDWNVVRRVCLKEARRVLGRTPLAEDAAQEATIRAWRNQRHCHTPSRPDPWLATIARREALRLCAAPGGPPLDADAVADDTSPGPADALDRIAIRQAVDELDAEDRELVVGRYWDDLSYAELAARSGMPISTVGVRLHRVRLRLRGTLLST